LTAPGDGAPALDADRVLADLADLAELTGGPDGARRVCWTETWEAARGLLRDRLAEIGVDEIEVDEAGNLWARLPGRDREAGAVAVGSHIDSVPAGGPLDGALGVMAALGILRAWAGASSPPARDIVLIDFADEEGSRFGRSLFGSSALAGTLVPAELAGLTDADGEAIADVLARHGVALDDAPRASARIGAVGSYFELHIEQGPVLESEGLPCSAVSGTAGVERHLFDFDGQASHAGTTPMEQRRDAGLAAAETAIAIERIARAHGGVGTSGRIDLEPGIITAVAGRAQLSVDLRHPEREPLRRMHSAALDSAREAAERRGCKFGTSPVWRIEPIHFDRRLVALAERAAAAAGGRETALASGALHDAAEMARHVPTVMVFVASVAGISHAKEERSTDESLRAAIAAYGDLTAAGLIG
jgi:beta-ureidopropionase / N-carbamoyl-L-amino-acid hydrolase